MAKKNYNLHLKGYVGGWDFDADYVDYVLGKNPDGEVNVLIDSLGGSLSKALSIVAAFRNHGNVNVHFVGMNASAATIASLRAKHVSMASSAMYPLHKCSLELFQWASANSDKLRSIIKEAEQMKEDLDKMDANVAEMYAAKCKREPSELLALMKKGGWLTAKEALEWGFVDEITDFEDDMAPVITDDMAADMSSAGIPMPENFSRVNSSAFNRFIVTLTNFFRSNQNKIEKMNTENSTKANAEEKVLTGSDATSAVPEPVSADVHAKAIADKDAEIKALRDEIEALKKTPGDSTSHIVDESKKGAGSLDPNSPEAFFETKVRAQELYDMLP